MSDAWHWSYDPDETHVIAGLPDTVVTEVERLASELAELANLGVDITDLGSGPRPGLSGGLRRSTCTPTDGCTSWPHHGCV